MESEYNELVQCIFQPKIKNLNKEQLKLSEKTADFVSGVKKFVEKKNKGMKMKIDEEKYR